MAGPLIFVFGSNKAGRHGKGAALHAKQHYGAIYGQGEGLQGNSYAIPTKDARLRPLSLSAIQSHAERFKAFARAHPELIFTLTPIGCGLAGYTPSDIAPLFADAPDNVIQPPEFIEAIAARMPRLPCDAIRSLVVPFGVLSQRCVRRAVRAGTRVFAGRL